MKKLFNKKFVLILGSTLTLLIILSVAMIFLTKENTLSFKKSGYIIASGKDNSTKYYFDEGTNYKTNINSQLVFTDTSGEKVNVETDNFLHYIDGGIKFLKNGVIMDLDNINATIVPYYNITNKSVLEYSKKSYYIETVDKTLAFNNIIGRISENKYIVAGVDIKLQLSGNDNIIPGDYFEITFIEDGIIKVENQEVSYQTIADNSYVLVSDNTKIDLGVKKIYYNDEEKMSLTQMTIDGNENIEILPVEEDKNDKEPENNNGTSDNNQTDNNGNDNQNQENNQGNNQGNNNQGNGEGGTGNNDNQKRNASIDIVEAEVGVNNISAKFIINDPDNTINGDLVLHITNTDTGKRVYSTLIDKTKKEINIGVSTLSPDGNYILSINEENQGKYDTQYFQKLFKTDSLGISLEKKYITSDSLAYEVIFENDSQVRSVTLNLYDEAYNEVSNPIVVTKDNSLALFENLKNNTTYNIVLDNVILDNFEYNKVYTMYKTIKTLKKTPSLSGLSSETDDETSTFTIGIDEVVDEDSSITKYSYYIYKANDITVDNIDSLEPVKIIEKNDASKAKVNIDNEKILPKTNYKYKVVAEYYDNEKYGEYETELSDNFILTGKPYLSFELDTNKTTFNKIVGTVTINDENCTVPINGRNCSSIKNYNNNFIMEYQIINTNEKKIVNNLKFDSETLKYNLEVDSLVANTEYIFNVYGDVDLLDGKGIRKGYLIGTFRANTNGVDILTVDTWEQNDTGIEDLINVSSKIISTNNNDNLANSLNNLTFNLYSGDAVSQLKSGMKLTPIATRSVSGYLKDDYYNKIFIINTKDTFGFEDKEITSEENTEIVKAIDLLKEKTGGKLQKYYTIEITDAFDEDYQNEILIENNVFLFKTPALILLEDELVNPTINADPILNVDLKYENIEDKIYEKEYNKELSDTTIVGYKLDVKASIDKIANYFEGSVPVKELIYYVCDANINKDCTIDNAIYTYTIDLIENNNNTETIFYLENGTSFNIKDNKLTRGHNYIFKAKFNIDSNNDGETDTLYPKNEVKTDIKETPKNTPTYRIYISKTTENQVFYKYSFTDIDNALYDNKFYYQVEDSEEQTTDFSSEDFVIDNLSNDSIYSFSFKQSLIKTEDNIENVEVGKYIFDGKYAYSSDTINFANLTYENDNRLRILILENEINKDLIKRVSAYQIVLSAEGVNNYEKVYPTNHLSTCTKDDVDYKCIIVDYANIKDFKKKDVNVKVTAYYDSGIINNDFPSLSTSKTGYILQNNNDYNTNKTKGKYVVLIDRSLAFTTSDIPYGMYEYTGNTETVLQMKRKININNYTFNNENIGDVSPSLTYAYDKILLKDTNKNYQSINNKLLSKVDLGTNNSTFKFNSYIPKISVSTKGLVNGSVIDIIPSGIDDEILNNEFKNEDGKYYFYLKIYQDEDKTTLYKEEKVEIDPAKTTITLTKYMPDTTYYFEVYAYMLKNNEYKETLLFDANVKDNYVSSTYKFSTLNSDGITYHTSEYAKYTSVTEDDVYAKRTLQLMLNTKKDIGEYNVRFELYDKEGNKVLEKEANKKNEQTSYNELVATEDITNADFVFGPNYYNLKVYIETEVYDSPGKADLLVYDGSINLKTLKDPIISVSKIEGIDNLKFEITITDADKVIKDGKYCVELLDASNKPIEGYAPKCDLSVLEVNKEIIFDGLTSDTLYIFRAYVDIYTNNVSEENKERTIESRTVLSTSTDYGVALGSVAAYGSRTSVVLSFSSGVNIKNIKKIDYTLMKTGGEEVKSESYIMGVDKNFSDDGNNVRLIINPEGLNLQSSSSYYIVMTFWVEKDGQLVRLNNRNYQYSIEF